MKIAQHINQQFGKLRQIHRRLVMQIEQRQRDLRTHNRCQQDRRGGRRGLQFRHNYSRARGIEERKHRAPHQVHQCLKDAFAFMLGGGDDRL